MTLKALIESVRLGAEQVDAVVTVSLNGGQTRTVQVTPENFDVVQLLSFSDILPAADNVVEITVEGEGNLMYQIAGGYYLPWDRLASYPELVEGQELVDIDIAYDRTELAVNDTVQVGVTVSLNEGNAESALIDLGVPPGFSLQAEDLAALVTRYDDVPADYACRPSIDMSLPGGRSWCMSATSVQGTRSASPTACAPGIRCKRRHLPAMPMITIIRMSPGRAPRKGWLSTHS
jgi:hypothetical protein